MKLIIFSKIHFINQIIHEIKTTLNGRGKNEVLSRNGNGDIEHLNSVECFNKNFLVHFQIRQIGYDRRIKN